MAVDRVAGFPSWAAAVSVGGVSVERESVTPADGERVGVGGLAYLGGVVVVAASMVCGLHGSTLSGITCGERTAPYTLCARFARMVTPHAGAMRRLHVTVTSCVQLA